MTQTLIEQLEKLPTYQQDWRGDIEPARGDNVPHWVRWSDLDDIIEQHKTEVPVCSHEPYHGKCVHCGISFHGGVPSPQPDIVAELVKALEDDAFAATFQSMAGYRTGLIAKVKGVVV